MARIIHGETKTRISSKTRRRMIAEAAYLRAESHGFAGDPESYWLEAEMEIDRELLHPQSRQTFQKELEEEVEQWDARIDELKGRAVHAGQEIRAEFEKQIGLLSDRRDMAGAKLDELRRQTEGAWEELKDGAEKTWGEMREALDRISSRFK